MTAILSCNYFRVLGDCGHSRHMWPEIRHQDNYVLRDFAYLILLKFGASVETFLLAAHQTDLSAPGDVKPSLRTHGPQFNIQTIPACRDTHHQYKTIVRPSCLYNGNSYKGWNKLIRQKYISIPLSFLNIAIQYHSCWCPGDLTHWGRVTHICVSKLTTLGSDNGLSPGRRQAIIWTNAGILWIGPFGTNFSEFSIEFHILSLMKMHLKMSSAKWRPFCFGLKV